MSLPRGTRADGYHKRLTRCGCWRREDPPTLEKYGGSTVRAGARSAVDAIFITDERRAGGRYFFLVLAAKIEDGKEGVVILEPRHGTNTGTRGGA